MDVYYQLHQAKLFGKLSDQQHLPDIHQTHTSLPLVTSCSLEWLSSVRPSDWLNTQKDKRGGVHTASVNPPVGNDGSYWLYMNRGTLNQQAGWTMS